MATATQNFEVEAQDVQYTTSYETTAISSAASFSQNLSQRLDEGAEPYNVRHNKDVIRSVTANRDQTNNHITAESNVTAFVRGAIYSVARASIQQISAITTRARGYVPAGSQSNFDSPMTFERYSTLRGFERFAYARAVLETIPGDNGHDFEFIVQVMTETVEEDDPDKPDNPENDQITKDKIKEKVECQKDSDSVESKPYQIKNRGTHNPISIKPIRGRVVGSRRVASQSIVGSSSSSSVVSTINRKLGAVRTGSFMLGYVDPSENLRKVFSFSLLPAIDTNMRTPGSSGSSAGVPEVKPGILIRTTMNHKKYHIPGAGPIYQNLGVDQMVMQLVGTVIGNEALSANSPTNKSGRAITDDLIKSVTAGTVQPFSAKSEALYVNRKEHLLNSYLSAMQLNNELVLPGQELELVLLGQMSDYADDIIRINFRGIIEGVRFFVVRSDRTYYAMDFIITRFGFSQAERTQLGFPPEATQQNAPVTINSTSSSSTGSTSNTTSTSLSQADPSSGDTSSGKPVIDVESRIPVGPDSTISSNDPTKLSTIGNFRGSKGNPLGEVASVMNSNITPPAEADPNNIDETVGINSFAVPSNTNQFGVSNPVPQSELASASSNQQLRMDNLISQFTEPFNEPQTNPTVVDNNGNQYAVLDGPGSTLRIIPSSRDNTGNIFDNQEEVYIDSAGIHYRDGRVIKHPSPTLQTKRKNRPLVSAESSRFII